MANSLHSVERTPDIVNRIISLLPLLPKQASLPGIEGMPLIVTTKATPLSETDPPQTEYFVEISDPTSALFTIQYLPPLPETDGKQVFVIRKRDSSEIITTFGQETKIAMDEGAFEPILEVLERAVANEYREQGAADSPANTKGNRPNPYAIYIIAGLSLTHAQIRERLRAVVSE